MYSNLLSIEQRHYVNQIGVNCMIKVFSNQMRDLVDTEVQIQRVASGFEFTEGPIWHPRDHHLLFSDIPGNSRLQYSSSEAIRVIRKPSSKCNGMTYNSDLNLLVCEHLSASVVLEGEDGRREVLATHFEGKQLNSPNDICCRSDDSIYFSDPTYGRLPWSGEERPQDLDFQGVFRVSANRELELLVDKNCYQQPNGLCFSPDESLFYINDSPRALIDVYKVAPDGSLYDKKAFARNIGDGTFEGGVPDGMKCDENGNIWVTGPGGLWIFNRKGEQLGIIEIPEHTANLHWGGSDWHTLFVTASTSVYSLTTKVGPHIESFMRT